MPVTWYVRARKLIAYLTFPPVLLGGMITLHYTGNSDDVIKTFAQYVFWSMGIYVCGNVASKLIWKKE